MRPPIRRNLRRITRTKGTYTKSHQNSRNLHNETPNRTLHRGGPHQREPTQRESKTEATKRRAQNIKIYTERHQNMRNLHREAPEHQESTQRHQIRSYTAIAHNKSYIERHQNRRNLHRATPNQKESTQSHQNRWNLHKATRRNLRRDEPEQKESTQ